MLQKAGGLFQLLSEVDFGTAYGIKSLVYKTRGTNLAQSGQFRLSNDESITWRNQTNTSDLALKVNTSNVLEFDGAGISIGGDPVQTEITVADTSTINLSLTLSELTADIVAGSITNSLISASAAIAYSKLNLTGSILNSDLANMAQSTFKGRAASSGTGAPVDLTATQATAILNNFVGDSGSGGTKGLVPAPAAGDAASNKFLSANGSWIVPPGAGDVVGPASSTDGGFVKFDGTTGKLIKNSAASIAASDIAALTASRAVVTDGSGFISASAATATEVGYLSGVTSSIQTQLGTKLTNPLTTTGDLIYSSSGTTGARLGIGSDQQILKVVSGLPAWAWPLSSQASQSTTYSIAATDNVVLLSASGGAFTATLPTAASVTGKVIIVKKTDSTLNAITIATTSSQTIDGSLTTTLNTQYEALTLVSDGSNWQITNRRIPAIETSYTPTGTGFTVSADECTWARRGQRAVFRCKFTASSYSATEPRLSLPSGMTSLNSGTIKTAGSIGGTNGSSSVLTWYPLIEPNVSYFTFGFTQNGNTGSSLTKITDATTTFPGTNFTWVLNAEVIIAGWAG